MQTVIQQGQWLGVLCLNWHSVALIENSSPPLPTLKSFLGHWFLQTRTDPLPPIGKCISHIS